MNYKSATLTTLFLSFNLFASPVICDDDSTLVAFDNPANGSKISFCQKKINGQLIKHGEYKETSSKGDISTHILYENNQISRDILKDGPVKKKKESKSNTEKELEALYAFTFQKAFDFAANQKKELVINEADRGQCIVIPRDRMNFLLRGKAFIETRKFRKRCFLQGSVHYAFNKNIKVNYEVKNLFNYNKLKYNLFIKRVKNKSGEIYITSTIKEARFTNQTDNKTVDFVATMKFKILLQDVMVSRGRKGLYVESGTFKVTAFNGKPYSFYRESNEAI